MKHTKSYSSTENYVLNSCIRALHIQGIEAWRNNTGTLKNEQGGYVSFGKVGSSDIIGILPDGRFLAVECKKPSGGKVSDKQKQFIEMINKNGGIGMIVHSAQEMIDLLKVLGGIKDGTCND